MKLRGSVATRMRALGALEYWGSTIDMREALTDVIDRELLSATTQQHPGRACSVHCAHSVDLSSLEIGPAEATYLSNKIARLASLTSLSVCHNPLRPEGVVSIASILPCARSLQTLRLDSVGMGPLGAKKLALVLPFSHLRAVCLRDNGIGPGGARSISTTLASCTSLTTLDLACNAIMTEGANAVALHAHACTSLSHLDLSCNSIGAAGLTALEVPMLRNAVGSRMLAAYTQCAALPYRFHTGGACAASYGVGSVRRHARRGRPLPERTRAEADQSSGAFFGRRRRRSPARGPREGGRSTRGSSAPHRSDRSGAAPPPFSALSTCKCSPLRFSCQAHLGSATIDLRGARLGGTRLRRLCDVMVSATLLQRLDLSGNELHCADAAHLAEVRDP